MSILLTNSVLDEIRRLYDNQESGTLRLTAIDGQRIDVLFHEGMIEVVSSNLL